MSKRNGRKSGKAWIIVVICIVAAAAIGGGVWFFFLRTPPEPVLVFPFHHLGMTEYWGDNQECSGPVTTDKIQTVFLSDTQEITQILVKQGDEVKKGDLLMTMDTTLSDLAVERSRLNVEKLKLQLQDAQDELQRIRNMRPMVVKPPAETQPDEENESLGPVMQSTHMASSDVSYDGSTADKAMILWVNSANAVTDAMLEEMRSLAELRQNENAQKVPSSPSAPEGGESTPSEPSGETTPSGGESGPSAPPEPITVNSFYVVIKVTQGNRPLAGKTTWQGLWVTRAAGGFGLKFFNASIPDHMLSDLETDPDTPDMDIGSGYTASQLAQMRADQEQKIKDLELEVRMAEAEYKLMLLEISDGNVYAQIDGIIVSLLDPEEAKMSQQPVLKLSGGGGFYVEGTVSELAKDQLTIGQEVTINDWRSGMTYTGTVESIGDFPSGEGYWNGMGNPNTTYYPFMVFVDGSADLQEGRYVSIQYSAGNAENGIYLQNPFLRTEQGRSYVFVLGTDGKLEKRYVTTGKALWGSYTEILEGLTEDDLIAFPYGKTVKDGAPAREGEISELYNY